MSTETPIEPAAPPSEAAALPRPRPGRGLALLAALNLALMAAVAYMAVRPAPNADARQAELTGKLSTLALRVEALEAAAQKPSATDTALETRIAALEHSPAPSAAPVLAAPDLGPLADRIAALEAKAAAPAAGDKPALEALDKRIAGLETARGAPDPTVTARLDALARDTDAAGARIATLEKTDNRKLGQTAALALAASLLGDKVRSGAPFAEELAAVARLSPETPALTQLGKESMLGVPSRDGLLHDFPAAARAARNAEEPTTQGVMGRIEHTLGALVTVRAPGASTENGLDGIAKALARDDPRAALAAADLLSPRAHAALEPFLARLKRRDAALSAVQDVRLSALNALMRATSPQG